MFFFGPDIKKMSETHNISGLLKIVGYPKKGKKNIQLRIDAINALSEFCHRRILEELIKIIDNDSEEMHVKIAADNAFKKLVYTGGVYTYKDLVSWWNQNKDDPKLITRNRSGKRFEELANVKSAAQRAYKPPKAIEYMIYQKSYNDSSMEFPELIEWQTRTQALIDDRIQAERAKLEAKWHEEDLLWERDEEILNRK